MPPQPNQNPYFSTILNPTPTSTSTTTYQSNPTTADQTPNRAIPQQIFTAQQRSLQARNKPFTQASTSRTTSTSTTAPSTESFESRARRLQAAEILDSVELLLWYSGARNESVAQTRRYYNNILLGLREGDAEKVWREEWEVPVEERVRQPGSASPAGARGKEKDREGGSRGKEKEREKVKQRRSGA